MATMSHLRYSPHNIHYQISNRRQISGHTSDFSAAVSFPPSSFQNLSFSPLKSKTLNPNLLEKFPLSSAGGNGIDGVGIGSGGSGDRGGRWSSGGGGGDSDDSLPPSSSSSSQGLGILGLFLNGWRSRVTADPQFPFKVLMEEVVGVSSCVLGDMMSRPNFGLNELDFVFSTLVVGSILNFTLMYLLAPTAAASTSNLPAIFANCPKGHMFEAGSYTLLHRLGTFVYKGTVFAAVGFAAGLVGTALSNGLMKMRKKMDPNFETPNKPPPTILNALTWAIHMGLSSNFRYQTLNGVEFLLAKGLPPLGFKTSVIVLRCLNNVLGGVSFVVLARLTGSQSVSSEEVKMGSVEVVGSDGEKEKLLGGGENLSSDDQSAACK